MGRRFNQSRLRRALAEALESRTLFSLIVPALNSLPGAPATLYLNFVGDNVPVWGNPNDVNVDHPGITKAFDIDGNATSLKAVTRGDLPTSMKSGAGSPRSIRRSISMSPPSIRSIT